MRTLTETGRRQPSAVGESTPTPEAPIRVLDTGSAPDAAPVDPLLILDALGHAGPAEALPVSGGADTAMWRIEQADGPYALRVFRREQAAAAHREVAAMALAGAGGIPVPAIHAEGVWGDRPALLLAWMPGEPLLHGVLVDPWRAWHLGIALGRMQAAIHAIPVPSGQLGPSSSWIAWGAPDDALRCLLLHAAGRDALLHLDLHPMNVLVEGREVTAVLDWANARAGDPRADLARTASILRFAPLPAGTLAPIVRRLLEAGWRRGYREAAGPIRGMAPFYAWAATAMVNDLSPRVGRRDLPWLTPAFLEQVWAWGAAWRVRAGLGAPGG